MSGGSPATVARAPGEFTALLDFPDPATADAFVDAAVRQMVRAFQMPPHEREGAYALLAADAHLTWACEIALDEGASADSFRELLKGFLARLPESGE